MSDLVTDAFWLYWFVSIALSILISRSNVLRLLSGIALVVEAIYLTGQVSTASINMIGVVLLGLYGGYSMISSWEGY